MSISGGNIELEPDRDQIEIFIQSLFRHASKGRFISFRSFVENQDKAFINTAARIGNTLTFAVNEAVNNARACANHSEGVVFCPPIATFNNRMRARGEDVEEGLTLTVDCDKHPKLARQTLERILGPATMVVTSGGRWTNPETNEAEDKLHLHWRLKKPATREALKILEDARAIARRIVDGDPTSKAVCHPIRWPGSWHRKGEPVMCRIESSDPDREIDLASALAALTATCPNHTEANGADSSGGTNWADAIAGILSGDDYHKPLRNLAAKMLAAGMSNGAAVNLLRGLMEASGAPRDERWSTRYRGIPRAVRTAREKFGEQPAEQPPLQEPGVGQRPDGSLGQPAAPPAARIVITLDEFLAKYEPPDYLVEGLLQRAFLYALTGATGAGKTAVAPLLAVTVALQRQGMKFGPCAVEHGRVVYIAAENQVDVQMRFPPLLARHGVRPDELDLLVIDTIKNIDKDMAAIERDILAFGSVDLILVDTSPRLFLGDNFNDDKQMLDHAVRLRKLTHLPGKPCVVALGHPVKYPKVPEDLLPKGGGAYLNELDGNLTLWKRDNHLTDLHWTGKFRGTDFQPISFRLDVAYSTANVDKKGNALPTVTATHLTDAESAAMEANSASEEILLLRTVQKKPGASLIDLATACGWFVNGNPEKPNKMKAHRVAKTALGAGLIKKAGRSFTLTPAGKTALKEPPTEGK